jgi:phosphoribosylglycinamide formyltransferase-1
MASSDSPVYPRIAVLASGGATAASCLWDVPPGGASPHFAGIITDKVNALALDRARSAGGKTLFIEKKGKSRLEWAGEADQVLRSWGTTHLVLAGFMRILPASFVLPWEGRIVNVHPSLLPRHAGLMDHAVHEAVLAARDQETGCTLHAVTAEVDAGEILLQLRCRVEATDTPESLRQKVQALEQTAVQQWIASLGA